MRDLENATTESVTKRKGSPVLGVILLSLLATGGMVFVGILARVMVFSFTAGWKFVGMILDLWRQAGAALFLLLLLVSCDVMDQRLRRPPRLTMRVIDGGTILYHLDITNHICWATPRYYNNAMTAVHFNDCNKLIAKYGAQED